MPYPSIWNSRPFILAAIWTASIVVCGDACAGSSNFKYDSLGRLIEVTMSNGVDITITYDAAGNRTIEKTIGSKTTSAQTTAKDTAVKAPPSAD